MNFCEQCGSTTRDKDGFCGGCGAPWPLAEAEHETKQPGDSKTSPLSKVASPVLDIRPDVRFFSLSDVQPKKVWVAIPLAVMFGPLGLLYCTMTGAIVMALATVPLWLLLGNLSYVVIPAISAFWAWRAARQSPSILD
jgi:hypothetical protein